MIAPLDALTPKKLNQRQYRSVGDVFDKGSFLYPQGGPPGVPYASPARGLPPPNRLTLARWLVSPELVGISDEPGAIISADPW